jgi:hypothetical protein
MDILRLRANAAFSLIDSDDTRKATKFSQIAGQHLSITTAYITADAKVVQASDHVNENDLMGRIAAAERPRSNFKRLICDLPERPIACLELIFLPCPEKPEGRFSKPKSFSITKGCFQQLFNYLRIDQVLLSYLTSFRSGWYYVLDQDGYSSFLYKDYMYTLAWTFHTETKETRGLLAARSDFQPYSMLHEGHGQFQLPGLSKSLLIHPYSLAFIAVIDYVEYMEQIIETDGYRIGEIEARTSYGMWVTTHFGKESTKPTPLMTADEAEEALRRIGELTGRCLILFKTIEIVSHPQGAGTL